MFKFNELKSVHLEISTRCQASCPMCPRNYRGGQENPNLKIADWSYQDFVTIFNEETLAQVNGIFFCGNFGDPIMNDDLIKMCQHVKDNAPQVELRIHTNGGARAGRWWQALRAALPEKHVVIFALDGLEDTHHIYRVGTKYEAVVRNAQTFIEAGGIAEWVFIKFKHNEHQVEEAERRSKELGFQRFAVKNTIRFIGEARFSVLDKEGNHNYYLEPPTTNQMVLLDKTAIDKFRAGYKQADIDCYVLKAKEIYIDAHRNVFPCCFLASAPYNHSHAQSIVADIRADMVQQYYGLVDSLGGLENLNAVTKSIKGVIEDERWQTVWSDYWGDNMLMTCARTCGKSNDLQVSQPKDQFVKRTNNG